MAKQIIITQDAPAPIGPYNQAVSSNSFLFVSGQIAIDPATGNIITDNMEMETLRVMENIRAILAADGLGFSNVVKTTIFLADMNNFGIVNEVYGRFFDKDAPARETVEVSRLPKDVNVEISVIASHSIS